MWLCVYMSLFLRDKYYSKEHVVQLLSLGWLIATPWTAAHHASLSFTTFWSLLEPMSIELVVPSNHLILCCPLLLLPAQHQGLFRWVGSSHQVAKVLEVQFQHQSFQWIFRVDFLEDWLVWSPCSPRDSQESSPAPQFEGINSSALSLFYCPAFTSIHEDIMKYTQKS